MKATSEPVDSITNKLCHTIKELGLKFWSGYKSAFKTMIVNCKTADMPVYITGVVHNAAQNSSENICYNNSNPHKRRYSR